MSILHYTRPATEWLEALPLGNGQLGAMCWGDTAAVRFDLNDETAWSGSPGSERAQGGPGQGDAAELLAEARALVASGNAVAAESPIKRLQSDYTQAYLPLGSVTLHVPGAVVAGADARDYRRSLDLELAVHTVRSGALRQRTVVSAPHGVLMHIIDGLPDGVTPTVELSSQLRVTGTNTGELLLRLPSNVAPGHETTEPPISWSEVPGESLDAAIVARVLTEQTSAGHNRTVLFVATGTTYRGAREPITGTARDAADRATARINAAVTAGSERVLRDHIADYRALFGRVSLTLGTQDEGIPTDTRIVDAADHPRGTLAADPTLAALLFDYGRYLLISSSRPGGLPANLQGLWNNQLQPPWSSNYTTNINLQMNYWAADVTQLAETAEPLVDFIEQLAAAGSETAERLYGADGWVAHHNSDAWAYTAPVGGGHGDPSWAFWPMAAPWLVRHLTERINFGDTALLERAWPIIRGAAAFAASWMVECPDGSYVTSPSTSPENQFIDGRGATASLSESSTMDLSLLRELFESTVSVAGLLGISSDPLLQRVADRLRYLPVAPGIGDNGEIIEWADGAQAVDPQHRHLSPLYALYPGTTLFDERRMAAAVRTLKARGDDSTGWSLAWKLALWARLGRSDKVSDLLALVFRPAATVEGPFGGGLYPNLFAAHPPFQIDGNLGFVAALSETLLQSHSGVIDLLPALPAELTSGRVSGLVARPGVHVDIAWADGHLTRATLLSQNGTLPITIRHNGRKITREITTDTPVIVTADDFT